MLSTYRPEIDGLRAIAVVSVVLFHLGIGCPGGFVGVDIFFVISGYLITSIIRRETEADTFSIKRFWERRVRRIFPALVTVVAVTLFVGYLTLLPNELASLGESTVSQSLLVANFYFWNDTGYFAAPAEYKPLLHTWSLAVEEQFYLLLPFVLLKYRNASRNNLMAALSLVAFVSFVLSVLGLAEQREASFFLLPARAWELLVGSILALSPLQQKLRTGTTGLLSIIGIALILWPIFGYSHETPFPGHYALPPVIGTALIILTTSIAPQGLLCRFLSKKPVVFIGLISYSWYLWHWPTIVFIKTIFGYLGWKQSTLAFGVSLTLAIASWRIIETPIRKNALSLSRRSIFSWAAVSTTTLLMVGAFFIVSKGVPDRFPNLKPESIEDIAWTGEEFETPVTAPFETANLPTLGKPLESQKTTLDFIVWGDSHAMVLCSLIDQLATELEISGKAITSSSLIGLPDILIENVAKLPYDATIKRHESVMAYLADHPPRNLILASRWSLYTDGPSKTELNWDPIEIKSTNLKSKKQESSEEVIALALKKLAGLCDDKNITLWIVKQVPETGSLNTAKELVQFQTGLSRQLISHPLTKADHQQRQTASNAIFDHTNFNGVRLIDPSPFYFDESDHTINYLNGRAIYRDNDHLTKFGLERMRPLLLEVMTEIQDSK